VERETAVARKRVQDAAAGILHALKDMTTAENVGATTRKPETMFEDMLHAIGESLSHLACSDDMQDGEEEESEEKDTELSKLSDDNVPGWVIGPMSKTVQHRMESFRQKQMTLDRLTQLGLGDAANYFGEKDVKYGTAELKVPAVVNPQMDTTGATPSPPRFGEHMQTLDIFRRQSQMAPVTSPPGCTQWRLGSQKPQSHIFIPVCLSEVVPNSIQIQDAKPIKPISFYPCK